MRQFIDELQKNDELTSTKIKEMLEERWPDVVISTTTINDSLVGCTHYCQLLREVRMYYKLLHKGNQIYLINTFYVIINCNH